MKNQAEILLLKNKLRLMKGTIRHTWQGIISVVIVGGVLLYQFFFVIAQAGYGTGATERGVFYSLLLVAAINSFRVFLSNTGVPRRSSLCAAYIQHKLFQKKPIPQAVSLCACICPCFRYCCLRFEWRPFQPRLFEALARSHAFYL
jgi:hypothetical protein